MLILGRKELEKIKIGDDITIMIVKIHGNLVHVGIDAPKNVSVHREEIYNRIKDKCENNKSDI